MICLQAGKMKPDIPTYYEINDLLKANNTGLIANLDYFHINRFEEISFTEREDKKGAHRTNFYGIVLIHNGIGNMSVNEQTKDYTTGLLAFTSPGQIVSWERKEKLEGCMLFFKPEFLAFSAFKSVTQEFPFFKANASSLFLIDEEVKSCLYLFNNLEIEYKNKDSFSTEIIRNYLQLLLSLFKRLYNQLEVSPSQNNSRKKQIADAFEISVRKNLPQRKLLSQYADDLLISEKHLIAIIKETIGKTPAEYIQEIFLLESKTLLTHTPYSIAEIAYRLNFQDPSYFSKVFKKHFGISPLSFKNQKVK
jgi:AraC family transcriptional activator of pobA